jgi:hypothetical protein
VCARYKISAGQGRVNRSRVPTKVGHELWPIESCF